MFSLEFELNSLLLVSFFSGIAYRSVCRGILFHVCVLFSCNVNVTSDTVPCDHKISSLMMKMINGHDHISPSTFALLIHLLACFPSSSFMSPRIPQLPTFSSYNLKGKRNKKLDRAMSGLININNAHILLPNFPLLTPNANHEFRQKVNANANFAKMD